MLKKFLDAQERDYKQALKEIRSGRKRSHWIWYIFPQLEALGYSSTAKYYGSGIWMKQKLILPNRRCGPGLLRSRKRC